MKPTVLEKRRKHTKTTFVLVQCLVRIEPAGKHCWKASAVTTPLSLDLSAIRGQVELAAMWLK